MKTGIMSDFEFNNLELELNKLVLEANFLTNAINSFKRILPNLFSSLKTTENSIKGFLAQNKSTSFNNKAFNKSIEISKRLVYTDIGEKIISKPENFQGYFLDYSQVLYEVASDLYKLWTEILPQYISMLSSFLTNKDDKISLKDYTSIYNKLSNARVINTNKLKQFFPKDNGVTKTKFSNTIARLADLKPLYDNVELLSKLQTTKNLVMVQNDISQCIDLINVLIDQLNKGIITNVSGEAANNIAAGAYEVAKFAQFIGIVYFDSMVFINIINRLADDIIEYAKKL